MIKNTKRSFYNSCMPFLCFGIVIAILLTLQLHNVLTYPTESGFDAKYHLMYVDFLKHYKKVPLASEGWELYQPPLYYTLLAFFPKKSMYSFLGLLAWIVLGVAAFTFFKQHFKNVHMQAIAVILTLATPVVIYLTPAVGNEFFAAVIISAGLVYYVLHRNLRTTKEKILLGLLLGLAMLSKATAFVLLASIVLDQLISFKYKILPMIQKLLTPMVAAFSIGGWFYMRNLVLYKNPFVSSIDFPQFAFTEAPADRGVRFFTDLTGFIKGDLFLAQHYSFWAGTYYSWFYDGHNIMVPVQKFSKAGLLLILLSLPIVTLGVWGFVDYFKKRSKNVRILALYPALLFVSYVLYNFKIPYYSTVKAIFLVSGVIPIMYFVVKGVEKTKIPVFFSYLFVFAYTALIIKNFWILPNWYR